MGGHNSSGAAGNIGAIGNIGAMKTRTDEVEWQQLRLDKELGFGQGVILHA